MPFSRADLRRWLDGFEQAARADRAARRVKGPDPAWSIAVALSLIDAARTAAGGRLPLDPRRPDDDEAVRKVWQRLRAAVR